MRNLLVWIAVVALGSACSKPPAEAPAASVGARAPEPAALAAAQPEPAPVAAAPAAVAAPAAAAPEPAPAAVPANVAPTQPVVVERFLDAVKSGRVDQDLMASQGVEVDEWSEMGESPERLRSRRMDATRLRRWLAELKSAQEDLRNNEATTHPTATGIVADAVGDCSGDCCEVNGTGEGWATFSVQRVCTMTTADGERRVVSMKLLEAGHP